MKKLILFFSLIVLLVFNSIAQSAEKDEVMATIKMLFDGMRQSDSSMVRASFHPNCDMATVAKDKNGKTILHQNESIKGFIKAVGAPKNDVWDEQIANEIIQIDGNMASVWCEYKFFINDQFSHCGVNSFQLVKLNEKWQIVQIIDTRRKENCN